MIKPASIEAQEICLITAVDIEFNAAASLLTAKTFSTESQIKICRGRLGHRRVTLQQCGMGAHGFANRLSVYLKHNRHDALLVTGLAGGLDPQLKSGDAVIYDLCHDARSPLSASSSNEKSLSRDQNVSIRCDDEISGILFGALQSSCQRSFRGSGVTVGRIITEAEGKISLGVKYQAAAVDMESYDVLRASAAFDVPAAVLRVISDEATCDLPDFNFAAKADGRMDLWRTAAVMTARPAASFQFLRNLKSVMANFRRHLEIVLNV